MAVALQTVSTVATASGGSLVLNQPSGVVSGDLLFAQVITDRAGAGSGAAISGWTQIQTTATTDDTGGGGDMTTFYRVATGSDTYTVTFSDAGESRGFVARISGQSSSSPVSSSSEQVTDVASTTATGGTVTPLNTGSLLLLCVGSYQSSGSQTHSAYAIVTSDPGGWAEAWDSASGGEGMAMGYVNRTPITATGNATATISASCKSIVHVVVVKSDIIISPDALNVATSVQAPTVTGTANTTASVISVSATVQDPTVTTPADVWSKQAKNTTTWTTQDKS